MPESRDHDRVSDSRTYRVFMRRPVALVSRCRCVVHTHVLVCKLSSHGVTSGVHALHVRASRALKITGPGPELQSVFYLLLPWPFVAFAVRVALYSCHVRDCIQVPSTFRHVRSPCCAHQGQSSCVDRRPSEVSRRRLLGVASLVAWRCVEPQAA